MCSAFLKRFFAALSLQFWKRKHSTKRFFPVIILHYPCMKNHKIILSTPYYNLHSDEEILKGRQISNNSTDFSSCRCCKHEVTRGTLCCHFDGSLEFMPSSQSASFEDEINWSPVWRVIASPSGKQLVAFAEEVYRGIVAGGRSDLDEYDATFQTQGLLRRRQI